MRWLPDAARGEWLKPLITSARDWGTDTSMHAVVPHGFEAYVRIFHPVPADRLVDGDWRKRDAREPWAGKIENRFARWSEVAAFTGTTAHPLMQWHAIARRPLYNTGELYDGTGWRYSEPRQGQLDAGVLADVASVLAHHTTTPDAGAAAVWEGWGGLITASSSLSLSMVSTASLESEDPTVQMTPEESEAAVAALFAEAQAQATAAIEGGKLVAGRWSSSGDVGGGTVPLTVVKGARLELPMREHLLVEAGISEFARADWPENAPWVAQPMWAESPSLIWPDDHAWVLVTEVDFDSTVVAGSRAFVGALLQHPMLEALEIPEGADLSSLGDRVNQPPAP